MREERMTVPGSDVEPGDILVYTADRRLTVETVDRKRVYVYIEASEWEGGDTYDVQYRLDDDVDIIRRVPDEVDVRRAEHVADMIARLRGLVDTAEATAQQYAAQVEGSGVGYAIRWGGGPAVEAEELGRWAGEVLDAVEGVEHVEALEIAGRAAEQHARKMRHSFGFDASPMSRAIGHHVHKARVRFIETLQWYVDTVEGDR